MLSMWNSPTDNQTRKLKPFERYADDRIWSEKDEQNKLLQLGNNLHNVGGQNQKMDETIN